MDVSGSLANTHADGMSPLIGGGGGGRGYDWWMTAGAGRAVGMGSGGMDA